MGPWYNIYITVLFTDGPIAQIIYTFTLLTGGLIDYFNIALGPYDDIVLLYINTCVGIYSAQPLFTDILYKSAHRKLQPVYTNQLGWAHPSFMALCHN
jgi:hypothetical protein